MLRIIDLKLRGIIIDIRKRRNSYIKFISNF